MIARIALLCLVLAAPAGAAQVVVRSFDGDHGPGEAACDPAVLRCGRQPEMNAAGSGTQVVQVTWQHVNVYDYNGALLQSTPLPDFVTRAGVDPMPRGARPSPTHGPYEPHVVFDEFIRRWIMSLSCLNDCLMVSASADARGAWHGIYPSCLGDGPCLNEDPALQLGYDKNGVYHCAGHLGDDNPNTIRGVAYDCFAIPPDEVKAIARGQAPMHLNRRHNMAMHIRPAVDQNPRKSPTAPALFATRTCDRAVPGGCQRASNFPFAWIVTSFTWKGLNGTYSDDQVIKTEIGSGQNRWLYNVPCCGTTGAVPQAGSEIGVRAIESHRLNNLVQFGSHLEVVFGSGPCVRDCGAQGEDTANVMFWADLDCPSATACTVTQTAKIANPGVNPLFPTIGVDQKGNVGIVAASSSEKEFLSILLWIHRASDSPNAFTGPSTVVRGSQPYSCPNNLNLAMIASAVGMLTVRDPRDGSTLWTTHQYSNDATPCVWNSRLIAYQPGAKRE